MADPISIIGAVGAIASIIDIISKSVKSLNEISHQWKEADLTCLSLAAQLTTMRAALAKIKEWTDDGLEGAHHQLIMDLDVSISCCRLLVLKIDGLLPDLTELTEGGLDFSSKMTLVFGNRNIFDVQKLIERQTGALTLLLAACTW